jgi:hypothetical protein
MIDQASKDHETIQAILHMLSGTVWSADTLQDIAALLTARGYKINEPRTEETDTNGVL